MSDCAQCGQPIERSESAEISTVISFVPGGEGAYPMRPDQVDMTVHLHLACAEAGAPKAAEAIREMVGSASFASELDQQQHGGA